MKNPFQIRWLDGWNFQIVCMKGGIQVEAIGFGIRLRTSLMPGESPLLAADRLVFKEYIKKKSFANPFNLVH